MVREEGNSSALGSEQDKKASAHSVLSGVKAGKEAPSPSSSAGNLPTLQLFKAHFSPFHFSPNFLDRFNPVIVLFLNATHTSECSPSHSLACTHSQGPRAKPGLTVLPVGVLGQNQSPGQVWRHL